MQAPVALVTLTDAATAAAPAASSSGGGAGAGGGRAAALHLSPDVMHAARLGAGDAVLVRARDAQTEGWCADGVLRAQEGTLAA